MIVLGFEGKNKNENKNQEVTNATGAQV